MSSGGYAVNFGDGNPYPEVNTFADLPSPPPDTTKHVYVVLTATGAWYTFNRKDSGMYFWNGSTWSILDAIPYYFSSSTFRIQDGIDNTKQLAFDISSLTTGTTRTITVPNHDLDLGQLFINGGNTFGANASLGTKDNFTLSLKTNNVTALSFDTSQNSLFEGHLQLHDTFAGTPGYKDFAYVSATGNTTMGSGFGTLTLNPTSSTVIKTSTNSVSFSGSSFTTSPSTGYTFQLGSGAHLLKLGNNSGTTFSFQAVGGANSSNDHFLFNFTTPYSYTSDVNFVKINPSMSVISGSGAFNSLVIASTYNQLNIATGTIRGIYYNPTVTSVLGAHYAWHSTSGDMLVDSGNYLLGKSGTPSIALSNGVTSGFLRVGAGFTGVQLQPSTGGMLKWDGTNVSFLQNTGVGILNAVTVSVGILSFPFGGLVVTQTLGSTNVGSTYSFRSSAVYQGSGGTYSAFDAVATINSTTIGVVAMFNAAPTLTAYAGIVAGFRGQLNSGTNVYNIYADGTAANYFAGTIQAAGYKSSDGSSGVSGTWTTTDGKTITAKDGLITSIV